GMGKLGGGEITPRISVTGRLIPDQSSDVRLRRKLQFEHLTASVLISQIVRCLVSESFLPAKPQRINED
ncbi:MAG: hypothetical protein ABL931_19125, partial [Usitatibacteraceae bacterium]